VDWGEIHDSLVTDPNDQAAWSEILALVRRWAVIRLPTEAVWIIDEVAGDACSAAVLKLSLARGRDSFATFVYGYFLNACRRYIQYRDRRERQVSVDEMDVPAPDSYDPAEAQLVAVKRCLECLPPRDRQAVTMRYFEEASSAAIAEALGVNDGYARRIVFNGLQKIRDCVAAGAVPRSRATAKP
jgi:RNA polymerase sigma factor (sigma-70 family)